MTNNSGGTQSNLSWKFGGNKSGSVTLSTTSYIEVIINNVAYKLAVVT
jgi:hypothetical protein